ncbi:hypothetical protein ACS5PK_13660 [Roseateles sp. DB2]|uniref:hypothetical protein n=1 Tax=Roseateles sp. DB2 TaxID=3453717 RepID=UPI003EEF6062
MSALVIKAWRADTKPVDGQNTFVSITGREGGLIAWLLSLMGVDPTTTIRVGLERVEFSSASLAGTESRMVPLQSVCSTYYGYHKPWKAAASVIALFAFLGFSFAAPSSHTSGEGFSLTTLALTTGLGTVFALLYYFLNRTLTLGFVEHSGAVCAIRFKRSVIENVDINEEQARSVCTIVQRLIEAKEKRALQAARS